MSLNLWYSTLSFRVMEGMWISFELLIEIGKILDIWLLKMIGTHLRRRHLENSNDPILSWLAKIV